MLHREDADARRLGVGNFSRMQGCMFAAIFGVRPEGRALAPPCSATRGSSYCSRTPLSAIGMITRPTRARGLPSGLHDSAIFGCAAGRHRRELAGSGEKAQYVRIHALAHGFPTVMECKRRLA